jgi:cytochrome c-type protein NapC
VQPPTPGALLIALLLISLVLVAVIVFRPSITTSSEGKILTFLAFLVLPVVCMLWGASEHIDRSKQTQFCLSCHVMEPYGKSLYVDNASFVPAAHFQNHRIPVDEACYTCHTDYAMYGSFRAKMQGLQHIYVQYLGTIPNPVKLRTPYNNRECLHCHLGARSFESNPIHMAILDTIKSNQMSCVTSGCHDTVHNVASLGQAKFWSPIQ